MKAVDQLSLIARSNQITGLIGPNGAGKTTTFNACTGVVEMTTGSIRLGEIGLDGMTTSRRAQIGLGRTFQRVELVKTATVRDNVALGAEALVAGRHLWAQLFGSHRVRSEILRAADREIERCGLSHFARTPTSELSTGQGRLVELARVLAADFTFLLLDEPSSGLDKAETEHFGQVVAEVAAERHLGILLVEHDMALIRQICNYIYVLDFGKLIYEGESADVLSSDTVRRSYLGEDVG
ncbi:MAG TPA: ATP-binding cassette domain-containing protein [Acidimicrobiales bacterium]|nr:ATP-binding cassette domain-containing protein [Acidimicrobiales bacterium]